MLSLSILSPCQWGHTCPDMSPEMRSSSLFERQSCLADGRSQRGGKSMCRTSSRNVAVYLSRQPAEVNFCSFVNPCERGGWPRASLRGVVVNRHTWWGGGGACVFLARMNLPKRGWAAAEKLWPTSHRIAALSQTGGKKKSYLKPREFIWE